MHHCEGLYESRAHENAKVWAKDRSVEFGSHALRDATWCKRLDLVGRLGNPEQEILRCTHRKLYDSPDILELVETPGFVECCAVWARRSSSCSTCILAQRDS